MSRPARFLKSLERLLGLVLCLAAAPAFALAEAAQPLLRVGVVLLPPYAMRDNRTQALKGANVEVMNRIAARLKLPLAWQTFPDLASLEAAAKAGEIDAAPGLVQTPAGLALWLYSEPYFRIPHKVVGPKGTKGSVDLEQLPLSDRVALPAHDALVKFITDNYPVLRREPVATERIGLRRLIAGSAEYAIADEAELNILMREPEFSGLAIVGDTGYTQLLRIASRKDRPELNALIDRALAGVPPPELDVIYARWIRPPYPRLADSTRFWARIALLFLLLFVAATIVGLWQKRQRQALEDKLAATRHELDARAAAGEALQLTQFSVDHSTVGILWVNWDSRIRYANRAAESMLGFKGGALLGQPLAELQPELDMDRWLGLWKQVRAEALVGFETDCRHADGHWLPVDVSLSHLRFGDTEYLVAFLTDETEKRRARAALEESEARLAGIAANVPGLVFRLERAGAAADARLAFLSEASLALVGYPATQLLDHARGLAALVHPDDLADYEKSWRAALVSQDNWQWQGRIRTRAGSVRWADLKASARRFDDGRVVWDGILWDISANKESELGLADSRAQLRELSAHLESVREEEKARIAREVHDELGQVLTVLKLETSMCEFAHAEHDAALAARLHTMKKLIDQTFAIVRDVATALRPPILDAGIGSAIEWQARRFEARTQIPVLVSVPETPVKLSDAKAVGLFRILQEALTNVLRHADAHTVVMRLAVAADNLVLTVADDGRGFAPDTARAGFGLVGIRERAMMLGGTLAIESTPGEGTTLTLTVPLDPPEGDPP
ncbi:PAS domain-containing sensor histidine kinase [Crenobacter cavernae]|uniref:Oxygen sensor histidine kinase NreB n=1 Tax=Crenobacter cavernae TaxID=2290923 RepID=A0ABY0FGI5_9NEIS|nr:sensor histidine kinase [Crenobacter cavernae]RXZ45503.1 PAS domain S-box protein [Crenobacter cavernae]